MKALRLTTTGIIMLCLLAPPAVADVTPTEREFVDAVSEVRRQHGVSGVQDSRSLARSAGNYSRWQLAHDYFGHQPEIRMSSSFSTRGEVLRLIIGRGVGVRRTMRLWMNSPSHRNAILYPAMRVAGAGIASGNFQGRRAVIVTVHLGAR